MWQPLAPAVSIQERLGWAIDDVASDDVADDDVSEDAESTVAGEEAPSASSGGEPMDMEVEQNTSRRESRRERHRRMYTWREAVAAADDVLNW